MFAWDFPSHGRLKALAGKKKCFPKSGLHTLSSVQLQYSIFSQSNSTMCFFFVSHFFSKWSIKIYSLIIFWCIFPCRGIEDAEKYKRASTWNTHLSKIAAPICVLRGRGGRTVIQRRPRTFKRIRIASCDGI